MKEVARIFAAVGGGFVGGAISTGSKPNSPEDQRRSEASKELATTSLHDESECLPGSQREPMPRVQSDNISMLSRNKTPDPAKMSWSNRETPTRKRKFDIGEIEEGKEMDQEGKEIVIGEKAGRSKSFAAAVERNKELILVSKLEEHMERTL
jgi:hypothetical protein